ncbi:hypothetical protein [Clostridium algidicarnis]|uniref:hypothetical protein n=1 Tax=Clostridium algidicarnis TaxID=37659 RepID=UPI003FD767AE
MDNTLQNNLLNNNYNSYSNNINSLNKDKTDLVTPEIDKSKDITNNLDTITISETNKTIINSKKAQDAFSETVSHFKGKLYPCGSGQQDITGVMADLTCFAQGQGIKTPLDSNFNMGTDYKSYIDNLASFAEKLSLTRPELVPPDFMDFCSQLKGNLTKYDYN